MAIVYTDIVETQKEFVSHFKFIFIFVETSKGDPTAVTLKEPVYLIAGLREMSFRREIVWISLKILHY